jgi:hypothetical protein
MCWWTDIYIYIYKYIYIYIYIYIEREREREKETAVQNDLFLGSPAMSRVCGNSDAPADMYSAAG